MKQRLQSYKNMQQKAEALSVAPVGRKANIICNGTLSGKSAFVRCSLRVRGPALTRLYKLGRASLGLAGALRPCRLPCLQAASSPLCTTSLAAAAPHGSYHVLSGASLRCPSLIPRSVHPLPEFVRACWPQPSVAFIEVYRMD